MDSICMQSKRKAARNLHHQELYCKQNEKITISYLCYEIDGKNIRLIQVQYKNKVLMNLGVSSNRSNASSFSPNASPGQLPNDI
jgi:hypothetical protein